MKNFDAMWALVAAPLLGVGVALLVWSQVRRRARRLQQLAEPRLLALLTANKGTRWEGRAMSLGICALLAGVALAGPRWGEEPTAIRGEGVDVVLALDASLSMLATDERPSRLERLKQEVRRYRALAPGDRVALLAFAGRSYILTPLTVDEGAIELFLDNLDPSIVGQAGSSIARTITQATELLKASPSVSDRALILMSDGESFEPAEEMLQAAQAAAAEGIVIVTVGFGSEQGTTIPIREGERVVPKRDESGATVITKYSPENLRAVAEAGHGTFIDARETDKASRMRAALQQLRAASRSLGGGITKTPRFQWFVIPALLLLLWDTLRGIPRRRAGVQAALLVSAGTLTACTIPGQTSRLAEREYRAGRFANAASLYRRALAESAPTNVGFYNLGTALVSADSLEGALEPLERASKEADPELMYRVTFNTGLALLKRGLLAEAAGDSSAKAAFDAAVVAYKRALLMRPTDMDAKWNYELALRKKNPPQGGGGGGGGGGQDESQQDQTPESAQPSGGLGQQRAEQLLNSAAREERGVQGRKQKQTRAQPPPGGKDW